MCLSTLTDDMAKRIEKKIVQSGMRTWHEEENQKKKINSS